MQKNIDSGLKVREAAERLRLTPEHVCRLLREGRLHGVKPGGGGNWRIPVVALAEYMGSDIREFVEGKDAD